MFFDAIKADTKAIHNAIPSSGYDTEKATGDLDAYEKDIAVAHMIMTWRWLNRT